MKAVHAEYVVFDVETTGLNPQQGDRILEIAAVKVKDGEIVDTFESFVNPQRDVPAEAAAVHNITNEMLHDAPVADQVLPDVIKFISGACLVGHNIKFDLDFLCYELSLISRRLDERIPAIDTLKMSKKLLPQLRSHRLGNLAYFLGAQIEETHRALADVKLTVVVLKRLLRMANDQGIDSFQEVYKQFGVVKPNFKIETMEQSFLF
ncbi:MAG: 3'-5' exonuclease [Candidatus Omnitrophica bacterium]|nr:3'-5' exonuclease [Candidatus Omnitrophota bacterium]MCB9747846.1 3'-5' exonuclease [Candidatus Omnitrophota bacterium]